MMSCLRVSQISLRMSKVYVCTGILAHACLVKVRGIFLYCSLLSFEIGSLAEPFQLGWQSRDLRIHLCLLSQYGAAQIHSIISSFSMGTGGLNSGFQACTASSLPSGTPSQPSLYLFMSSLLICCVWLVCACASRWTCAGQNTTCRHQFFLSMGSEGQRQDASWP